MPKRTIKTVYFLDAAGQMHPKGAEVDLSRADADRYDKHAGHVPHERADALGEEPGEGPAGQGSEPPELSLNWEADPSAEDLDDFVKTANADQVVAAAGEGDEADPEHAERLRDAEVRNKNRKTAVEPLQSIIDAVEDDDDDGDDGDSS